MTQLSLTDLVGPHLLQGCDWREGTYRLADFIRFKLDGKTYLATEDDVDGYRSRMQSICLVDEPVKNLFRGVRVLARMKDNSSCEILEVLHAKTGEVILEVGTNNIDDYYPSWVATFNEKSL